MRKKLLAGILALALCSTNMPPQTIFAEEFTSGNQDVVSEEETPEIFTNEELEAAGETDEELSVFSSDEVPEFNDAPDEAMAAAENEQAGEIVDLADNDKVTKGVYTIKSAGNHKFTCRQETGNRIVVDGSNILAGANINIYLNNVNINTFAGPALQIRGNVEAAVTIHLTGTNNLITKYTYSAGLQKDNEAPLIIKTNDSDTTAGILNARSIDGDGAGIGGGYYGSGSCSNIIIDSCSVIASSKYGAGIGGSKQHAGSNITINSSSVIASSTDGAGIGGGGYGAGSGSNITINSSSVTASSTNGDGIGGGYEYGGSYKNITINGGSVKASSVSGSPTNKGKEVYCCTIENPENANVTIKTGTGSSVWNGKPVNHSSLDPDDTNLYVWLPKFEGNSTNSYYSIILNPENGSESRIRNYSFDTVTNTFKAAQVVNDFIFKSPVNPIYDGQPKEASLEFKFKPTHENDRTILLKYYKGKYENIKDNIDTIEPLQGAPVNAGTYTVKAEIGESKSYFEHKGLVSSEWTFTIKKASVAPGVDFNKTSISVLWSCKKISDITNPFPADWKWDNDVNPDQELQVGKPITATAIYNGDDKGNYEKESITYTITRSQCTHEHTAGRYYSSPSCTSSGYSGDTYCTDCNETLSYGYTISAYGHDYDNGVITTEPTTETDGIITYTCKRCRHQDTKNLGKLGDGEPYIEGSFQKKSWDTVNDLIKTSKEKDTISIIMNGARTLPVSVLSGIKGKDISLNLDMENGFIWKINGTSITAETPADTDLSVTNTAEYIPAALYSLIYTNQNDFGFHLGRNGTFDFPAVLSVKADASCAGLMANLFWYDVENGVLQCIQTVTVGGAFEDSIPYADFTLSKGQDYFIAFGTESLNGRVIHTDGSITDENGAYLRPADTKISSYSIDRNKLTVKLSKGCAGAQGYDFVISKKSNMLQTGKFSKKVSSTGKPQASFRYLAKGTWYVAARSWVLDARGNKVYGSWTKIKKIKITVVTPQQPKIKNITVEGNTVTVTYTKCKNATGYEILLRNKYKTSAGEKYPVKKHLKRTEGKNTVTVTFTNVKKGNWYVTVRSWNRTSKNKSRVYSPYSTMKKFKTKK
ncbi:hypothetical protein G4422_07380 [Blautia wexlerae]|uniref:hypothetical protein n=1 Tax=Blautia wexlerae TaxID=418240 RepID=UPI00156F0D39|nr:hypothetical protein [Blautia wexlerae]NSE03263.1 hypothetical protein [Blautia wexlerae]NSF76841.1 hypothetical protein [Blautia wexlerae]